MRDTFLYDTIIVGAGPVGLFLACELRLAGLSVLVLEQAAEPHSQFKRFPFGMRGLSAPTIEALDRRGLLDELAAPQRAGQVAVSGGAHWMRETRRPGGHFAGIFFYHDKIDASKWPYRLPSPAPIQLASSMDHIESVLATRATAMGVEIRRGAGVALFQQSDEAVTVQCGNDSLRGRWLVGCDGGRSAVRKNGGFSFVGTEPEFTGYSVEVVLENPDLLAPGRHYTPLGMYTFQAPGTVAMVDFDGGVFHRSEPTREHVQAVLRRISNIEVTVKALTVSTTWTDRAFQASAYREGRVLLAGDAAHIHSPLGGQGLNLGLGDAMNLGWKLAATIRGDAPAGLIDTYFSERHPVGAKVLDWSRAQVALMRPAPSSRALEAIIRDLIDTSDGATYFAERVWGVSTAYALGGTHPLVGRSVPDLEFEDGRRVGDLMRSGRGLLLDFRDDEALASVAQQWSIRIDYAKGQVKDRLGLAALLVRPDGIVAWSCVAGIAGDAAEAAARWFGEANPGTQRDISIE